MTAIGVTKHTPGHDWKRQVALDAVLDRDNMPLDQESAAVVADLDAVRGRF